MEVALRTIAEHPERYQSLGDGIHVFRMKRFPFYLFYHFDISSEAITIYAVAHHNRRPNYWRKRLDDT